MRQKSKIPLVQSFRRWATQEAAREDARVAARPRRPHPVTFPRTVKAGDQYYTVPRITGKDMFTYRWGPVNKENRARVEKAKSNVEVAFGNREFVGGIDPTMFMGRDMTQWAKGQVPSKNVYVPSRAEERQATETLAYDIAPIRRQLPSPQVNLPPITRELEPPPLSQLPMRGMNLRPGFVRGTQGDEFPDFIPNLGH